LKLSVIIVNYNVKHFLEQCLISVFKAIETLDAEVFVVDNNSVDGSVEMLQESFKDVHIIANKNNVGFSSANNQAIKQATGEYILLLNPDTIVPENCFQIVLGLMDADPTIGASGVRMVDGKGKFLPESKRGLPTPEVAFYKMIGLNKLFPKSKRFGKYHLGYLDEHKNHEVEILAGAFMMLRRSVLDEIGLLDETFFMYGEDIDLSYRITQAGYKNMYIADTSIIHYKGESTKKLTTNYIKVFYKAMVIFAKKHYSGSNQRIFTFLINSAIYARAGIAVVQNFFIQYWLPLVETVLIFGSLYLLKGYWEEHIKYIKSYPREMLTIHLPYYTLVWLGALFAGGSYKQPFRFNLLIRSILLGTFVIFTIYGLLPDHLRFSRGIILFGTLVVTASLIAFRTLYHLLKYRNLSFDYATNTKSILVGNAKKWDKLGSILKANQKNYQQLGFVSNTDHSDQHWLGSINQLEEIVKIYGVNEIIFSGDSISTKDMLTLMAKLGSNVNYYMIPANTDFIIGSNSKNANGLYFGEQIELNLSQPQNIRNKRLFDFVLAVLSLVLSPIFMVFNRTIFNPKNSWEVLIGKRSWIGYSSINNELPPIKKGIVSTSYSQKIDDETTKRNLDYWYARNYSLGADLSILFRR
jgi:GT2 family glycosyltransferase